MRVNFLEETLEDFKAFSGKHTLALDLPGVTFVRGENQLAQRLGANGASKSTLWDGLCWCLYGRTPGGLRNPDIMPWNESGNPGVIVRLEVDKKKHAIQRTANPNKLLIDDADASQDKVEALIGMGFDLFTNTILLAQGKPLFFDLSPKDKMGLFSDTLQLDRWDTRSIAADKAACAAEADLADLESEKRELEAGLTEVERLLADTKIKAERWVAESRKLERDVAAKRKSLQAELDKKDKQLAGALLKIDGAGTELEALNREYRKEAAELSKLQSALTISERRQVEVLAQIEECKLALHNLIKAKNCPTCGQPVKTANLEKHKAHLEEKLHQLQGNLHANVIPKLKQAIVVLEKRLVSAEQYAESFRAKATGAEHERNRLQPEVATLRAQLGELRSSSEENPHTQQLGTLQTRRKKFLGDLADIEKDAVEASRHAERNKFWVKGFKDIKLQLIEDVLEELELVTNGMLEEVGLVDWEIRYDIERETKSGSIQRALNVKINSPESRGKWVKWENWSGGEQQRLRLIGALALADVLLAHAGVETNLEILDEPALYWSTEGVQELCVFLAERARQTKRSIFYIEHQAVESNHFSNVLTVVRDKKGAYIDDNKI